MVVFPEVLSDGSGQDLIPFDWTGFYVVGISMAQNIKIRISY